MRFLEADGAGSLQELILTRGCYTQLENQRIYAKWFAAGPRRVFRAVDRKYGLTNRRIADIGCAYGTNLVHCDTTSYGIEIERYEVDFARSLGLTVYHRDVLADSLADLPPVEAVWCSAVLEHVDSPHIFLRKLHGILEPDGLLALYVPTIPLLPGLARLPRIGRYFRGFEHGDHINAFVPQTLQFFCESAGFATVESTAFISGPLRALNYVPLARRMVDGCVYIGRKIPGWEYPDNSTRRVAENTQGFSFVGQVFGDPAASASD